MIENDHYNAKQIPFIASGILQQVIRGLARNVHLFGQGHSLQIQHLSSNNSPKAFPGLRR